MPLLTTEKIQHFIGYLHLQDLLNLNMKSYIGAPVYVPPPYEPAQPDLGWDASPSFAGVPISDYRPFIDAAPPPIIRDVSAFRIKDGDPVEGMISPGQIRLPEPVFSPPQIVGPSALPGIPPDPELLYRFGENPAMVIWSRQENILEDNDIVLGDTDLIDPAKLAEAKAFAQDARGVVDKMIAEAEGYIPGEVAALFDVTAHDNKRVSIDSDEKLSPSLKNANPDAEAIAALDKATYVNGELVAFSDDEVSGGPPADAPDAPALETAAEQIEAIQDSIERLKDNDVDSEGDDTTQFLIDSGVLQPFEEEPLEGDVVIRFDENGPIEEEPAAASDAADEPEADMDAGAQQASSEEPVVSASKAPGQEALASSETKQAQEGTASADQAHAEQPAGDPHASTPSDEATGAEHPASGSDAYAEAAATPVDGDFAAASQGGDPAVATAGEGATDGVAQHTELGENVAVNAAILQDFGSAFSSSIIVGDAYETNTIVQLNVFQGVDTLIDNVGASTADQLVEDIIVNNTISNEATFSNVSGELFGDAFSGFYGSTQWRIDYNYGDLWDVTTLEQQNVITDNDINLGTPTQSHYYTSTGANNQLNTINILELDNDYDLIIIGGDQIKHNTIVQVNVLYDADFLEQLAHGDNGGSGSQSLSGAGNEMINDAGIFSTGGRDFHDLNEAEEAQEVLDAVVTGQDMLDGFSTLGLPSGDVLNVLYVTGDYHEINLVYQHNTVIDSDYSSDDLGDVSEVVPEGQDYEQDASGGGNILINAAAIVEQESTSDYQFLGGELYEETMLVQANILGEDLEATGVYDDLDEDVVAAVAALSGDDDIPQIEEAAIAGGVAEATDVMGGVMS